MEPYRCTDWGYEFGVHSLQSLPQVGALFPSALSRATANMTLIQTTRPPAARSSTQQNRLRKLLESWKQVHRQLVEREHPDAEALRRDIESLEQGIDDALPGDPPGQK